MGDTEANRQLEERTLLFAVAVVRFVADFPKTETAALIAGQLLKCGTAIGASYREANRAESGADFAHLSGVVLKQAAETVYWLDLCTIVELGPETALATLSNEAKELLAIFTTINHRARRR